MAQIDVTGEDVEDDLHAFHTADRERAEGVLEIMREDLERAELVEHGDGRQD